LLMSIVASVVLRGGYFVLKPSKISCVRLGDVWWLSVVDC